MWYWGGGGDLWRLHAGQDGDPCTCRGETTVLLTAQWGRGGAHRGDSRDTNMKTVHLLCLEQSAGNRTSIRTTTAGNSCQGTRTNRLDSELSHLLFSSPLISYFFPYFIFVFIKGRKKRSISTNSKVSFSRRQGETARMISSVSSNTKTKGGKKKTLYSDTNNLHKCC